MGNAIVQSATITLKDQGGGVFGSVPVSESLSFTGTPSQLGVITINTNGDLDFGTRSIASQQWWQVGDIAYDKDGLVTLLEAGTSDGDILTAGVNADAFTVVDDVTARRGTKAGESNFAYESDTGLGNLIGRFTVTPLETATLTSKAIWGFTGRWTDNIRQCITVSYSANIGTFDDGDNENFIAGETFTGITSPATGSAAFDGYIIKYDTANTAISFRFNGSYDSAKNNGASITGDISGATATFDGVRIEQPSPMKMTRTGTDLSNTPTSPEIALSFVHSSLPQLVIQTRTSDDGTHDDRPSPSGMTDSLWEDWMWTADYSGSDYIAKTRRAGVATSNTYTNPNSLDFSNVPYEMVHILLAFDWAGNTNTLGHLKSRMKDPWLDYEFAGAYLGDASTLATCTKLVPCRSESWSATAANVRINWGETTGTGYLYVLDDNAVWQNELEGLNLGVKP